MHIQGAMSSQKSQFTYFSALCSARPLQKSNNPPQSLGFDLYTSRTFSHTSVSVLGFFYLQAGSRLCPDSTIFYIHLITMAFGLNDGKSTKACGIYKNNPSFGKFVFRSSALSLPWPCVCFVLLFSALRHFCHYNTPPFLLCCPSSGTVVIVTQDHHV